jgi:hypothetical protein
MYEGDSVTFVVMKHQQCKLFRHSGDWSGTEILLPKCPVGIELGETVTLRQLGRDSCRIERMSTQGDRTLIVRKKMYIRTTSGVMNIRNSL